MKKTSIALLMVIAAGCAPAAPTNPPAKMVDPAAGMKSHMQGNLKPPEGTKASDAATDEKKTDGATDEKKPEGDK